MYTYVEHGFGNFKNIYIVPIQTRMYSSQKNSLGGTHVTILACKRKRLYKLDAALIIMSMWVCRYRQSSSRFSNHCLGVHPRAPYYYKPTKMYFFGDDERVGLF
jgi:hypothetical protein